MNALELPTKKNYQITETVKKINNQFVRELAFNAKAQCPVA